MNLDAHVEPLTGTLPPVGWRWDAETDILSGSFSCNRKAAGLTGTVEMTDEIGSIVVLDIANGAVCGLDVVVWPEVTTVGGLRVPPALAEGRVVLRPRGNGGLEAVEVETELAITANADESVLHLRIGPDRETEVIQVADHLFVEIGEDAIAGFWLTGVPPFPAGGEY